MLKWKLMLTTLPYVGGAVALKVLLDRLLGFPGFVEFGDMGLVVTGGVFLIGFMLAGTMADYKESERLPGELACTLETLDETFTQAALAKPVLERRRGLEAVLETTEAIRGWLFGGLSQEEMYAALERLSVAVGELEQAGATPWAVRALNELNGLRKVVTRIGVIARTGFLATGYALLEALCFLVIGLLMIAKFKYLFAEIILVAFITLIFVYMLRLIKDIDDPFEYEEGGQKGCGEVELFPLLEYRARLQAKLAALKN
jgi:hypothetical protein